MRTARFPRWSTAIACLALALAAPVVLIATTRSAVTHAVVAVGAIVFLAGFRIRRVRGELRRVDELRSGIVHAGWGRALPAYGPDPFASLYAACDGLLDALAEYHADRTAALDIMAGMLGCNDEVELVRTLKRGLRKLFARDAGAVYFAVGGRERQRRVAAWRLGGDQRGPTPPICFRILVGEQSGGILALHPHSSSLDGDGRLREQRRMLAELVARQIGQARWNLQLRDRLRALSVRDGLTGLHNRRYFDESAAHELEVARRRQGPLALALFDVDHFKRLNDEHGHRGGDAVLRDLGRLLQAGTRASDILCRYGGEEFALLLPGATAAQARQRAEALLAAARAHLVPFDDTLLGPATLSAGVAAWPDDAADLPALIEAADRALYQAKRGGRDRVAVAEVAPAADPAHAA